MLRGARLVSAQETEEGRRWAESRIKALTGGDPISARFMRQDFFTYTPTFKPIVAGNHKPAPRNVDEAMRRRLHFVPFTVTIPRERRDTRLPEKLRTEWPGILAWAVEGAARYVAEGIDPPAAVLRATAQYFEEQDLFAAWLADCCDVHPSYWEAAGRVYPAWRAFCEAAGHKPGTRNTLADRLREAGFREGQTAARGGRYWAGLRLKHQEATSHWSDR